MKNSDICIVMPAMNEALTISGIVTDVVNLGHKIIVVDDASTDDTADRARNAGAVVISHTESLGAWKATQSGLRYADKARFDIVVTMDADGQHDAKYIELLVSEYMNGADVVIGCCTERGSAARHIAWRFFKYINRLNITDITSGFRLYNKRAVACLVSKQATMLEYQCIGVLLMLRNMKFNIVETSVPMKERENGISRIFHSWLAVGYYLAYSGLLSLTKAFPTVKEKYMGRIVKEQDIE